MDTPSSPDKSSSYYGDGTFVSINSKDLKNIIVESWKTTYEENAKMKKPCRDLICNKIFDNLFIGDEFIAVNIPKLQSLKITHILNASQGNCIYGSVNTNEEFYAHFEFPCVFLGVPAENALNFPMYKFFSRAASFIDSGIKGRNTRVLVHSQHGRSRSATLVCAYLMLCKHYSSLEAVQLVGEKRIISPNIGFLRQLSYLEFYLRNNENSSPSQSTPLSSPHISSPLSSPQISTPLPPIKIESKRSKKSKVNSIDLGNDDGEYHSIKMNTHLPQIKPNRQPIPSPSNDNKASTSQMQSTTSGEMDIKKMEAAERRRMAREKRERRERRMNALSVALRKTAAEMEEQERLEAMQNG